MMKLMAYLCFLLLGTALNAQFFHYASETPRLVRVHQHYMADRKTFATKLMEKVDWKNNRPESITVDSIDRPSMGAKAMDFFRDVFKSWSSATNISRSGRENYILNFSAVKEGEKHEIQCDFSIEFGIMSDNVDSPVTVSNCKSEDWDLNDQEFTLLFHEIDTYYVDAEYPSGHYRILENSNIEFNAVLPQEVNDDDRHPETVEARQEQTEQEKSQSVGR